MEQFKEKVARIEKIIYPVTKFVHMIATVFLVFMTLLTTANVFARFIYKPIKGSYELLSYSSAMLIFFSLGYAQIKKEYISVSFIVDQWSPKIQSILDMVTHFITSILMAVASWQMVVHAKRLFEGHNVTVDLGIPIYIFAYAASVGLLIFALAIFLDFLKSIVKVVET